MQQAMPYTLWRPFRSSSQFTQPSSVGYNDNPSLLPKGVCAKGTESMMGNMVSENAVIVFARRGCCMSHVMKRLLWGLGVNPAVHEVEEKDELTLVNELEAATGDKETVQGKVQFPAVFIGGKLFGGLDRLMATHISGDLTPMLKEAGALWL